MVLVMAFDEPEYFSISNILATQTLIPCKFEVEVLRLGYLDPSNDGEHLPQGTKLDIPLWLAKALCGARRKIVSVEMPAAFNASSRAILQADANVVHFQRLSSHFYELGLGLVGLQHPESIDIGNTLIETFKSRFRRLMDSSLNEVTRDTSQTSMKWDRSEMVLLRLGQQIQKDFQDWREGKSHFITTPTSVTNHRKRKRSAIKSLAS